MIKNKSELLLPVGNMSMCLAAIHNGADAIYVGMPYFNARGRTEDFSFDDIKEIIDTCHLYGVKVHLAFNVLIFESEIPTVIELLEKALALGPDAFIVQDLGLVRLIKMMAPEQVIHASTQMTISNFESMNLLEDLDIDRFVLARECSLKEIQKIKEQTNKELEVFVHGALCVSYSGQCFTSEAIGGRSANRGQCAQSCRFDYQMIVDGVKKELVDKKYLVSPQDLCGINEIPKLQEIGIDSFKVEGRLKTPEYVASCASNYSKAIKGINFQKEKSIQELQTTFSRGFFSGWLYGVDHQKLVDGTYGNHRGIELGLVKNNIDSSVFVETQAEIGAGAGVLITDNFKEIGANIFEVKKHKGELELKLDKKSNYLNIKKGMRVFLNKDPQLEKKLKKSYSDKELQKKIPLLMNITGKIGQRLEVIVSDGKHELKFFSEEILEQAQKFALDENTFRDAFGSLGHTCFVLKNLNLNIEDQLFLNQKELKNLKRNIVKDLYTARTAVRKIKIQKPKLSNQHFQTQHENLKLNILLRNSEQLFSFINYIKTTNYKDLLGCVYLDYEFGKDYEESVTLAKHNGFKVFIATTRILKPFEYHNLRQILRAGPDGVLVRNLGAINFIQKNDPQLELKGDFSLNVTNSLTFNYLKDKNIKTLCPGNDLNFSQLNDLINKVDASSMEVVIHQYMPEFHMEHCVFAAFLSEGSSFKDCGKPCEKHQVELIDMYGNNHFLKADQECRNTMYLGRPQSASSFIPDLIAKGVGEVRMEALHESDKQLIHKIETYFQFISGEISIEKALSRLNLVEKYGVNTGQLSFKDNYKDIKKV